MIRLVPFVLELGSIWAIANRLEPATSHLFTDVVIESRKNPQLNHPCVPRLRATTAKEEGEKLLVA